MKTVVLLASILRIILIAAILSFAVYANAQGITINTTGIVANDSAMGGVSSDQNH